MKIWVIMENDFPCAVRETKEEADKLVAILKLHWENQKARVYVRAYEFDTKEPPQ